MVASTLLTAAAQCSADFPEGEESGEDTVTNGNGSDRAHNNTVGRRRTLHMHLNVGHLADAFIQCDLK